MSGYQITEKDIQDFIQQLKREDPDNADRDYAIQFLETLHASLKKAIHTNPEFGEELLKALKKKRAEDKSEESQERNRTSKSG